MLCINAQQRILKDFVLIKNITLIYVPLK